MLRTLQAADIAGIRAMAVHAKGDEARAFYERFGFTPSPTDPHHLFLLLKDIRAALKRTEASSLNTLRPLIERGLKPPRQSTKLVTRVPLRLATLGVVPDSGHANHPESRDRHAPAIGGTSPGRTARASVS